MMIFIIKFLSRCAHVTCTILLFTLCVAPLLQSPSGPNAEPTTVSQLPVLTMPSSSGKVPMILVGVMIFTGLLNSHFLQVGTSLAHSAADRLRWRMHVYFLKGALVLCMSPMLEAALRKFGGEQLASMNATGMSHILALTRAYVVLILAGIGSYCKVFREDSIARHLAAATNGNSDTVGKNKKQQ